MFKEFFEDTVAADIAQSTPPNKPLRKRKDDGPCKGDPMGEECQKKRLQESPVGSIGRTGVKDAKEYVTPELRTEFKKIVKKLGGKTVAKELLNTMNAIPTNEKNVTEASKKVRMLEKELKKLIEYTGKYALIDSKPEYYDSVLYVEDRNDNIYSIIISEVIK